MLRNNRSRQRPGQESPAAGMSLVIVILLSLGVVLTGLAVLGRVSFSGLGAAWQSQSREAREAAEIGMARIVSELNRERNRRLLVNASVLNSWNRSNIESSTNEMIAGSYCTPDLPQLSRVFSASTDLKAVQSIDAERRFQLMSITQPAASAEREPSNPSLKNNSDANNTESFKITTGYDPDATGGVAYPARAGEITITVRGMAFRNNTLIATTTLSRSFEVLPKCCWGSLGGYNNAFGPDSRPCPSIGFGIVGGAAENDTGEITIRGASADIVTGSGENIPFIYCIATATTTCDVDVNQNLGTRVKVVDIEMPTMPEAANTTCVDNAANDPCNITLSGDTTLDTGVAVASWPGKFAQVCSRDSSTPPITTCSIVCVQGS